MYSILFDSRATPDLIPSNPNSDQTKPSLFPKATLITTPSKRTRNTRRRNSPRPGPYNVDERLLITNNYKGKNRTEVQVISYLALYTTVVEDLDRKHKKFIAILTELKLKRNEES